MFRYFLKPKVRTRNVENAAAIEFQTNPRVTDYHCHCYGNKNRNLKVYYVKQLFMENHITSSIATKFGQTVQLVTK